MVSILKIWAHSLKVEECTEEKLEELNRIIDNEVLLALGVLEELLVLRKMKDK